MAIDLFRVTHGVDIENEALTTSAQIMVGAGAPGGDTGIQDSAPLGSLYLRTDAGPNNQQLYIKNVFGGNSTTDWKVLSTQSYVDSIAGANSWRDPVKVWDDASYANLAAAEAAMNTTTVDGITVVSGDRILYNNITGSNKNVYIINGNPGASATLVEDTKLAVDGDVLLVQQGTWADQLTRFDGTDWAAVIGNAQAEIDLLETALGSMINTDGTFNLTALDTGTYMDASTDVTGALLDLDTQIATNAGNISTNTTNIGNAQTEIDAIETSLGAIVDASGVYQPFSGTNYIDGNASLTVDLTDLDAAIAVAQTEVDNIESGSGGIFNTSGVYVAFTGTNYINGNADLYTDLTDLDAAIKAVDLDKISRTGDTMDSGANLTFTGGGEVIGLPTSPSGATSATSKAYVDNLVTAGTVWRSPINDPSLVGVTATEPGGPQANTGYIATAGGTWTGSVTVVAGDYVYWDGAAWTVVQNVVAGNRFIIAGEAGYVENSLYSIGFREGDLIEYVSGAYTSFGSWATPSDDGYQVIEFGTPKASGDSTGLTGTTTYTLDVSINGTPHTLSLVSTGTEFTTYGTLASGLTTQLNAAYTGASCVLEPEGHFHIYSGDGTKVIISEGTGGTPLLTALGLTDYLAVLAGILDGVTVLDNDGDSAHYSHTYTYTSTLNTWTEIAGPGAIGDGIGLYYVGNVLNINLGAGITQLPTDEVGVDVHANGGLLTTVDGTTPSTVTSAQLAIKLADSTLTLSAGGLAVSSTLTSEIDAIETSLGTMVSGTGTWVGFSGTNYLDATGSATAALTALDTQIATNAGNISTNTTNISNNLTEINAIETSLGSMVDTAGAWVGFTGTNYLDATGSTTAALTALDTQVGTNASDIATLQSENGDEANIRAFIGKDAFGVETPNYTSNNIITASTPLESAIGELDDFVDRARHESASAAVTTATVIDSVLVDNVEVVKWIVHAKQGTNVVVSEVLATHDGTTGSDATSTDTTIYAKLKIGSIGGAAFSVTLSGAAGAQTMNLVVEASASTDFKAIREVILA